MFNSVRQWWQRYLDGATAEDPYQEVERAAARPALPAVTRDHRPDPYQQLAPERLDREWRTTSHRPVSRLVRMAPAREYEATLADWAKGALNEFDRQVGRARAEMHRFVQRAHGVPVPEDWETPQFRRRTARNETETTGELVRLTDEASAAEVVRRMLERARYASDPETTGRIPVITDAVRPIEEAWA